MADTLSKTQYENSSYRDGYDALRKNLDGYSSEVVAQWLMDDGYWPHGPAESGAARVRACLNPDKSEFFKFSEIIFLMNRSGRADALYYACDATQHERPGKKRSPHQIAEEELEEIQRLERELEQKKRNVNAFLLAHAQAVHPSPRGIRRMRYSLRRLWKRGR
jgi:hypothetical protein